MIFHCNSAMNGFVFNEIKYYDFSLIEDAGTGVSRCTCPPRNAQPVGKY